MAEQASGEAEGTASFLQFPSATAFDPPREFLRIHQVGIYETVDIPDKFDGSKGARPEIFICRRFGSSHESIDGFTETGIATIKDTQVEPFRW